MIINLFEILFVDTQQNEEGEVQENYILSERLSILISLN